jgi:hypothetical protein
MRNNGMMEWWKAGRGQNYVCSGVSVFPYSNIPMFQYSNIPERSDR